MNWTESTFDTGEVRLHVYEGPASGPPVVFLHGATGSSPTWFEVAAPLTQRFHVYLVDLRGHNLSTWGEGPHPYHFSRFVADTSAFLRLRVARPVRLAGHSLGAIISMLTAADPAAAPFVQSVVAEDPPLSIFRPDGEAVVTGAMQYFNGIATMKAAAHSRDELRAAIQKNNPQVPTEWLDPLTDEMFRLDPAFLPFVTQWGIIHTGMDFPAALAAITCPLLLMQADPAKGAALADEDAALVQRLVPQTRLVLFPGASHGIHSEQPTQYLAALEGFLG